MWGLKILVRKDQKYRWVVAGAFGFVHGAGFSGHLTGLLKSMLGMGNIWGPLMGFNIGIEAGQLLVVAVVFPVFYYLRKIQKQKVVVPVVSVFIAIAGAVMMVNRIWGGNERKVNNFLYAVIIFKFS